MNGLTEKALTLHCQASQPKLILLRSFVFGCKTMLVWGVDLNDQDVVRCVTIQDTLEVLDEKS